MAGRGRLPARTNYAATKHPTGSHGFLKMTALSHGPKSAPIVQPREMAAEHAMPGVNKNQTQALARPADADAVLSRTLEAVKDHVRRYVIVDELQAVAITLWIAHSHTLEAFDCTPYLQITSATKQAGKTRLLEILETLVARPWLTGRVSAAVLVRKTDAERPTLLLDESDAAFKGEKEYTEALRGILNTGYRRRGTASLCIGRNGNFQYKDFSTFGAKAIAGIGNIPDTVADRSIRIELRRRRTDEQCARWRERDGRAVAEPHRAALEAWASDDNVIDQLRSARPEFPAVLGDRQADVWEPLLAIADLAGDVWPSLARRAAIVLSGARQDTDIRVELLRDIRFILSEFGGEAIATDDLLFRLNNLEDRPWSTWRKGAAITGHGLSRLLGPFGIHPSDQRVDGRHRSYRLAPFRDAFSRYLPGETGDRDLESVGGPGDGAPPHGDPPSVDAIRDRDWHGLVQPNPTCPDSPERDVFEV